MVVVGVVVMVPLVIEDRVVVGLKEEEEKKKGYPELLEIFRGCSRTFFFFFYSQPLFPNGYFFLS